MHYVAECIINATQSWNVVAFEIYREAKGHSTRLAGEILLAITRQTGQQGIIGFACLYIYGSEGVDGSRVFLFGRGRASVEYEVKDDGLTRVSIVRSREV